MQLNILIMIIKEHVIKNMKKQVSIILLAIFLLLNIVGFAQCFNKKKNTLDLPNKNVFRYWNSFNRPQQLTIISFIPFHQEIDFKYPYDTLAFNNFQNYFKPNDSITDIYYPFHIPFTSKFDTIECRCRVLDIYTSTIYEHGEKKMIPREVDVFIMEKDNEIIAVYSIDPKWRVLMGYKYRYVNIKITDLLPLKMEYCQYLNYWSEISFISHNYLFRNVGLNPYYIICDKSLNDVF